jgi:lysophospholipase L1-like esterase
MKTIIIYSLIFWMSIPLISAQTKEMDTVYRPRTYYLLVDQFRSYADSAEDVIFLGNSITAYTNWNELLRLPQARNRGISGDTTYGILERLDEITEGKPAKVFILIGINDISRNVPAKLILKNCEKILNCIKSGSPETKIYFQTILPVNNTFTRYKNHYNKDDIIHSVNEGLKIIAEREKITLIDLHPYFLDKDNRLDKKYTEEGLHLNAEGYKLWAELLLPYLK